MWLFIASEAILFGSLFSCYVMLRAGSTAWPGPVGAFPWLETLLLVGASAAFGSKRSQLVVSNALGLTFVVIKVLGDAALVGKGITPATDLMWACWFALTGVLAASRPWRRHLHRAGWRGLFASGWRDRTDRERWLARIDATRRYWLFLDLVWLFIVAGFYF